MNNSNIQSNIRLTNNPSNSRSSNNLSDSRLTRRDFIKASAITTGGLMASSLPLSASAYAGGSDTLKLALIGCGDRGTGAVTNALNADEGVQLVAMADIMEDRLEGSYEQLSMRYEDTGKLNVPDDRKFLGFDSYKQAIALADVVVLATPTYFRPLHFEEAVRQGKQIFMEKPVACNPAGVRRALEAGRIAKDKGLNVVVGLQRRYQHCYREVFDRIQDGGIGDIISGQVFWNQGLLWIRERQPEYSELEYQIRNWYYFIWMAGDQVLDQLIHNIDVANWFLGEYPASAQGMGGCEVRTGKEYGENFDHHAIEYTYPSGIVISSQCRQIPGVHNRVDELFQGSRGTVYTRGFSNQGIIRDWNGNIRYEHDGEEDPSPYQQEMNELFASIRAGDVIANADRGAKTSMTAIMGLMASYTGQLIEWEEALNAPERLAPLPEEFDWDTPPPVTPDEDGFYAKPVPGESRYFL